MCLGRSDVDDRETSGKQHVNQCSTRNVNLIYILQSAVIKENATNTRSADGEWKLTQDKFMKVVRKMLNTKSEEEFGLLQEVCGVCS